MCNLRSELLTIGNVARQMFMDLQTMADNYSKFRSRKFVVNSLSSCRMEIATRKDRIQTKLRREHQRNGTWNPLMPLIGLQRLDLANDNNQGTGGQCGKVYLVRLVFFVMFYAIGHRKSPRRN